MALSPQALTSMGMGLVSTPSTARALQVLYQQCWWACAP